MDRPLKVSCKDGSGMWSHTILSQNLAECGWSAGERHAYRPSPPAEAIPLMAAATTTPEVLPRQLRPVVLPRIQLDDFYHFSLLHRYNRFAFRKPKPHQGNQHKQ